MNGKENTTIHLKHISKNKEAMGEVS